MSADNEMYYSDDVSKAHYVIRDMKCPNCEKDFKMPTPRYNRIRLKNTYENLRAEYEGTEPVFYEVVFCPHCGYSRLKANFDKLNDKHRKAFKMEIGSKYRQRPNDIAITAQQALERYKFGLVTAKAMSLPASEYAVLNYKLSWVNQVLGDQVGYIQNVSSSYKWFEKALAEENFPVMSIDNDTVEYLMSVFAKDTGDYATALKHCGVVLTSATASDRLKNRARDLKVDITKLKERYPNGKNTLEEAIAEKEKMLRDLAKQSKDSQISNYAGPKPDASTNTNKTETEEKEKEKE